MSRPIRSVRVASARRLATAGTGGRRWKEAARVIAYRPRRSRRSWRRMALMTERDPDGRQQIPVTVAEVQRTGRPRPRQRVLEWSEFKAELGL